MQTPFFTSADAPKISSKIALFILHSLGWKLRYNGLPAPRGVMIYYPHTSNWDFVFGMLAKWSIAFPLKFLAKEQLFQGLTGFFIGRAMRAWGGEPIERGVSSGAIPRLTERIHQADWFWLAIAPEGTRRFTPYLRSGFYHIALSAKVPLVCIYIDYPKREIGVRQALELSGDEAADLAQIRATYEGIAGKYPLQQSTIDFRRQ